MAMNAYQKAIKKLVGIQPPDPLGTGVKPAANTTGAATGESVKPASGATGGAASGASPSILPGVPGQGTVSKPVGTPGMANKTNLPQNSTIYKQALDEATNGQYTSFYKPPEGFGAMSADNQAIWSGIGQKFAAGDPSYLTDTNGFRTNGNWGSYTDENGNINGWLQVLDGTGGFAPVFGGKVGETGHDPGTVFAGPDGTAYIAGADGILKPAGTVTYATYGKAPGPGDGSLHGPFTASDGKVYNYDELSPKEAAQFGLVNSPGGGAHIGSVPEMTDQALAQGATTPEIAALVQEDARMEEQGIPVPGTTVSGSSSGSSRGSSGYGSGNVPADTTPTGTTANGDSTIYKAAIDEYDYGKAPEWEGSPYMADRDALLEQAKNLEWNYDPNTDPVWQAYQKQYRREGQRAIQDTLGRYSQLTGGLPSSYATSAAAQAGNYYAAQLSDRLPQLYQDAYQRYLDEYKRLMGLSDQYAAYDQTEYNRFDDTRSQWNKDREFNYGAYRDTLEDARKAEETAYNRAWDEDERAYKRAWDEDERDYKRAWDEDDRAYGRAWDEDERAYKRGQAADQTAYSRAIYEREYNDDRLDRERELANQQEQTDYNRGIYADELARQDYEDAMSFLTKNGFVTGRYAEALGVPNGTTLEEFYRMNGIPLPEEAPVSGGGYTGGGPQSPPDDDDTPPIDDGEGEKENNPYEFSGEKHPNGLRKTVAYDGTLKKLRDAQLQYRKSNGANGMSAKEIRNEIRRMILDSVITDYEGTLLLTELGYLTGSDTQRVWGINDQGPVETNLRG